MIDLLKGRAKALDLNVQVVSVINLGQGAEPGRLGGWDFKRREIQIQKGVKQGRVFVLAHELMHAELAFSYEDRPQGCAIEGIGEMEEVVHSATEKCLEEMGLGGYREF